MLLNILILTVIQGDSIIIVKDWIDILKLGPETFDRELKVVQHLLMMCVKSVLCCAG